MPNPIDLQKTLSGVSYPNSKQDIISHAKSNGVDKEVLAALNKVPDGDISGPDQAQNAVF